MGVAVFGVSDVLVGFELHLPLDCATKLFCSCPVVSKGTEPNNATCPTCLGMPGSKPVLNKRAVDYAIKLALALNCKIEREIAFSRKTYFYPDMNKNFQISQYEIPLGRNGFVKLNSGKEIRIRRVHLEEDPGALIHEGGIHASKYVLVDYNRAGVPLCEIVTEPDISSQEEAKEFLDKLKAIVAYLDIFDVEKFVIKADTNISIKGGERVEIKNVTGTKNVEIAINYELRRQKALIESGKKVVRETRGFDEATGATKTLRRKETEADYGFIIDTDLVPTEISEKWESEIRKKLPEFPEEKKQRLMKKFGLREYDAIVIVNNKDLCDLLEKAAEVDAKIAVRLITRELLGILYYNRLRIKDAQFNVTQEIVKLVRLLKEGKVSEKNAKESLIKGFIDRIPPTQFLEKNKLLMDIGEKETEKIVERILKKNKKAIGDYGKGEEKTLNFLVGLVMKETKGKAEPRIVQKMIKEKIGD